MENLNIRRRNKLRHHFTTTSNVLLFGYSKLSDGAKVTYQVIDSFDWADSAGLRKGFAYPSLARLATIRGVDERTVRRHLVELERARLITRQERPGRPNLLIIEDASELETFKYLRDFAGGVGEDKIVLPTPDKNVRPLKKEKEETDKIVNEEQALKEQARGRTLSEDAKAKRDYLAQEMVNVLHDQHSFGFYRQLAQSAPPHKIFEGLSIVRQLSRESAIKKSRGAAFTAIMKRDHIPDKQGAHE